MKTYNFLNPSLIGVYMIKKMVIRLSDIKLLENSLRTYVYVCPFCLKRIISDSTGRVMTGIRLHMKRKHDIEVEFR
jgi:hypothetical protein